MKTIKLNKLINNKTGKPIEISKDIFDKIPTYAMIEAQMLGRRYRKVLVK